MHTAGTLRTQTTAALIFLVSVFAWQPSLAEDAPLTDTEMKRGRILFFQCRACHSLTTADNAGKIGPSLAGVFTRSAAGADYYENYSSALQDAGHAWTSDTMNTWIAAPSRMVPGTSMVFAGIADEAQRALLVRYLQSVTQITKE